MDLSEELALTCGVYFLAHAEECSTCDTARWDEGILRLCVPGRSLFATWLLSTLNEPEGASR